MNRFLKSLFISILLSSASFSGYAMEGDKVQVSSYLPVRFSAQVQDSVAKRHLKNLTLTLSYGKSLEKHHVGAFLPPTQGDARHSIADEHGQTYFLPVQVKSFQLWLRYTNPTTNEVYDDLVINEKGNPKFNVSKLGEFIEAVRIEILNVHTQCPQTATSSPVRGCVIGSKYHLLTEIPSQKLHAIAGEKLAPEGTFANDRGILESVMRVYKGPGTYEHYGHPVFTREAFYVVADKAHELPDLTEAQKAILEKYVVLASVRYGRANPDDKTQPLTREEAHSVAAFMEHGGIFEGYMRDKAIEFLTTFIPHS